MIKSLAELQQPDEASLLFSPLGLGAKMRPEDAADFQQRVTAQYTLSSRVPESTRLSFERVCTIYSYGVLCYELYTVAGDQARLVAEQALRDRFLPFYGGVVNFVDGQGQSQVVTVGDFDALHKAIRTEDGRLRGWKLQLADGRSRIAFSGEFSSLLRWARAEGILGGQRDRVRDDPRVRLRNFVAHPTYHLGTPVDAANDIADLAAIINGLWGVSPGAQVRREVLAVGWDHRTVIWGRAAAFDTGPLNDAAVFVLVLADPDDDLASYDARYETTTHPCDYLWGPGSWPDAWAWLQREQPHGDDALTLDRLSMLRYDGKILYLPQAIPVVAGLPTEGRTGLWYLIRADSPADAFSHQRQTLAEVAGHKPVGHCICPVETIGDGAWSEALSLAAAAGANVTPRPVPDVRSAMSRMPRCNEILGNGSWTIPAECQ